MPIEFRCRSCSRLLRTGDGTAGQTARCPDCGSLTVIPEDGTSPSAAYGAGAPGVGSGEPAWHGAPPPPPGSAPDPFDAGAGEAGANPYQTPTQSGMPGYGLQPRSDGRATASLVIGIVGLLLWCCPLVGVPLCAIGLALGVIAAKSESRNVAVAGIVLNIIGLLLSLVNGLIGALMAVVG